ncbi:MAG: translation initiation factor IF-2 subunit gamma [Candidatus Thermoplasmatota archaeon]|jgi:translation initiation factor 2 subunit 3|nr:translation initiation factor IF-2 subunit gamma [Candidatus Thermoplasmatota archaeon]MCL5963250.1 translation initiation factor IF-2 subunit gamma [Candidatus Thermoplasmatota archaeon]
MKVPVQPEINIGMIGHVDHGKTSLVKSLTNVFTDTHSEEKKRGISIKLGYADAAFYKCSRCPSPDCYSTSEVCPKCGAKGDLVRTVSFVDTPGHETLMATMLSGAAIMNGVLLIIAANEKCPQPQTKEHLLAIEIVGIKHVIVVQNKIDLVSEARAEESFKEIKNFLKNTTIAGAPIVPVSANHNANIDVLIEKIMEVIPKPTYKENSNLKMYIARSFDVNKPGSSIDSMVGGIIGGTIKDGSLSVGDEIEIKPGISNPTKNNEWIPIIAKVSDLHSGGMPYKTVMAGGLIGIETELDPSITKADGLIGSVIGRPGMLPPVASTIIVESHLLDRVVGSHTESKVESIKKDEGLMLSIGTATTKGIVTKVKGNDIDLSLKIPVCVEKSDRVAISRKVDGKWRLIGYGKIKS